MLGFVKDCNEFEFFNTQSWSSNILLYS